MGIVLMPAPSLVSAITVKIKQNTYMFSGSRGVLDECEFIIVKPLGLRVQGTPVGEEGVGSPWGGRVWPLEEVHSSPLLFDLGPPGH